MYPLNSEQTFDIENINMNKGDVFKIKEQIEGEAASGFNYYFDSYHIKKPTDSDEKISVYIAIGVVTLFVLILIIYFSRKNKK